MNLSKKIAAAVEATTALAVEMPTTIRAEDESGRFALSLLQASAIGIESDRLEFVALDKPAPLRADQLKIWGDRLAARVNYLMEPLVVLEVDEREGAVELRSKTPTPRDGRRSYYEIVLGRDASAAFARVAFNEADRRRESVPFLLTREVFERLVDDLMSCSLDI